MFMPLYEFLIEPLGLPIEWYWEYVILWILDRVAYLVARNTVRDLYDMGMDGRAMGSFAHCVIRTSFFAIVWVVTYAIIWACKWLFEHWVLAVSIIGSSVFVAALIVLIVRFYVKRKEDKTSNEGNEENWN